MAKRTVFKFLLPFAFLLVVIFIVNWVVSLNGKQSPHRTIEKSWPVQSSIVQKTSTSPEVILYGQVESPELSTVVSSLDTDVKEGNIVKKNELLIKLNSEEFDLISQEKKAAIEDIKAQIESELVEYQNDLKSEKHYKRLVKTNETMMKRLETLQVKRLEAQSNVDEAMNKLLSQQIGLVQKELEVSNHVNRLTQLKAKQKQLEASYQQSLLDIEDTIILAPFKGRIRRI